MALDIPEGFPAGTYTNITGAISAVIDGVTYSGLPASDTVVVVVGAPTLFKEFTDDPVVAGDTADLEFTISHDLLATADATGITFTDDLADVLAGLTATGLGACGPGNGTLSGSVGGTLLTFSGAILAPGETCTFSVTLQTPAAAVPGAHANTTSSVVAIVAGAFVTGNAAADDLQIAGLSFGKEFIDGPAVPGGTTTLEFIIDNNSPTLGASSIIFLDDLDDALTGTTP